jgi:hypothetical protein
VILDDLIARGRAQLAGVLLVLGCACFWASWALMPIPGTRDAAFILRAVAASRAAVLASCVLQLVSAATWVAGLVLAPGPSDRRGRLAWWGGATLLAVGMTASSADAIYHLAAYELAHPEVAPGMALPVMTRLQGADLLLLLPGAGAFFLGLPLFAVAGVQVGLVPRGSLWVLAAAPAALAARVLMPGTVAPRVAGLLFLFCAVAPIAWIGWALARRGWRAAGGRP